MSLANRVHITRRFQLSIRIDTDLRDPRSLEGFACPKSSADVLAAMAKHVVTTGQGAFTWTGPYGSGKSSLALAFSALLNGDTEMRELAYQSFPHEIISLLRSSFPLQCQGWRILPVVGQRGTLSRVIGDALVQHGFARSKGSERWTDSQIMLALKDLSEDKPSAYGGLLIIIDEMGKFLEGAARDNDDIFLFQQLAEAAARSKGRLLVVGILHQAFDEYARRLSREVRDEWSKVQGRFVDLAVNASGEEQIELIARAIQSEPESSLSKKIVQSTAETVRSGRPGIPANLEDVLGRCWPLHPAVTCLLGPISRRRFGQNQRSLFSFLNSAEPFGFQDFLKDSGENDLYFPERLWEYLRANLEPAILASPDGHRWSMAIEVIERCAALGAGPLHMQILKTIALFHLFREQSGLRATPLLLSTCISTYETPDKVQAALEELRTWSFILFRKHLGAYTIYAGSDFDIEQALTEALEGVGNVDFGQLRNLAELQPIIAKRHYHNTGSLRWFEVDLISLTELPEFVSSRQIGSGAMGYCLLVVPTKNETSKLAKRLCKQAIESVDYDLIIGLSHASWHVVEQARELLALKKIADERPELGGDSIARREVHARIVDTQSRLKNELRRMLHSAEWYKEDASPSKLSIAQMNILASRLADTRFALTPKLPNELLNRERPSSNAIAAQKNLLRQMVQNAGQEKLGICGYPAEGGLFDSILLKSGLYQKTEESWVFALPTEEKDCCRVLPVLHAAVKLLTENSGSPVGMNAVFKMWEAPPFGVKSGLLPVLGVALLLAHQNRLSFYREGIFQPRFTDLDIDYITKNADSIQVRWMEFTDVSREILSSLAEVVRRLDKENQLVHLTSVDVARGLISIYFDLKHWVKRTSRLSTIAIKVRDLFKQASDPNKFLFDDILKLSGQSDVSQKLLPKEVVSLVSAGLEELTQAYPEMLARLQRMMLTELQVTNAAPHSLAELRCRAENIHQLTGEFRLDAFIVRLKGFNGNEEDIEGIASLASSKPPRDWVDADLDRASIEIADMAQRFIRAEAYARIKGRSDKRQAMAVVVGMNGRPTPVAGEFTVKDTDRSAIVNVITQIEYALVKSNQHGRNIILAALAELSARFLTEGNNRTPETISETLES